MIGAPSLPADKTCPPPPGGSAAAAALALTRIAAIWKIIEVFGLAVFLVVVPPMMGPARYGQFAALVSMLTLLTATSGLGGLASFGRFLPEFEIAGRAEDARALFVQMFWTRTAVATVLALGLLLLLPSMAPGLSPWGVSVAVASFLTASAATTCFQVFYGLRRFGRWSCQEALTRIVLILALLLFGGGSSLDRAAVALLVTNVGFLILGLFWTRELFAGERTPFRVAPLLAVLKFGMAIFVANLLLIIIWRLGEPAIMLLSRRPSEAAFFNVANAIVTAVGFLIMQGAVMLTPLLTPLYVSRAEKSLETALGVSLKYLTIAAVIAILLTYASSEWIFIAVLGSSYAAAAVNMKILVLGLPGISLVALGTTEAMVRQRLGRALAINAGSLTVFAISAWLLTPRAAGPGVSAAVTLSMLTAGTLYAWDLRPVLQAARFGRQLLLGALGLLTITWLPLPFPLSPIAAVGVFLGLLFLSGVIHHGEWSRIVAGLRGVNRASE